MVEIRLALNAQQSLVINAFDQAGGYGRAGLQVILTDLGKQYLQEIGDWQPDQVQHFSLAGKRQIRLLAFGKTGKKT